MARALLLRFQADEKDNLRRWMEEAGWSVECPPDLEQAQADLANGRYQMIVQLGEGPEPQTCGCPRLVLSLKSPETSSILIDHAQPTVEKAELLSRLGRLRTLAHMHATNELQARWEACFATLPLTQLTQVLSHACGFLAEQTQSANVVWIAQAALATKDIELLNEPDHCFLLKPLFSPASLTLLLGQVRRFAKDSNETVPNATVLSIAHPFEKRQLGYFCLLQPQASCVPWAHTQLERLIAHAASYAEAQKLSYLDDLTGLYNQRYLPLVLAQQMSRAQRDQRKLSVLFIDVDYFKTVNDRQGHMAGSHLLKQMAELIQACTRTYDYAFRYGGDEFVVVLPGSHLVQAQSIAERIRSVVATHPFVVGESQLQITVSIGIATFPDHALTPEQVLHLADQAMYHGKNVSRNIVYLTG